MPADGAPSTGHWRLDMLTTGLAFRLFVHPESSTTMMRYWLSCASPTPDKPPPLPAMHTLLNHLVRDTHQGDVEFYAIRHAMVLKLFAKRGEWTGFTTDSIKKRPVLNPIRGILYYFIRPEIPWGPAFRPFDNVAATGIGEELCGRSFNGNARLVYYIDRPYLVLLACTLWVESMGRSDPRPDESTLRYLWESTSATLSELAFEEGAREGDKPALITLSQWFADYALDSAGLQQKLTEHLQRAQDVLDRRHGVYCRAMERDMNERQ